MMSADLDGKESVDNFTTENQDRFKSAFGRVLKRQPTPVQLARLERIGKELGLPEDDAIWVLFIGCEYYLQLYGEHFETSEKRLRRAADDAMNDLIARYEKLTAPGQKYQTSRSLPAWMAIAFLAGGAACLGWTLMQKLLPAFL